MNRIEKGKENSCPRSSHSGFWAPIILGAALLSALFLLSRINFLLFHVLTELFSVGIMWAIFILVWNTRNIGGNPSVLFLGIAFFFIGLVDTLHIISYKGMGVFPGNDPNLATQFWIVGRYLQSIAFLVSPLLFNRQFKSSVVVLVFTGITTLLIAAVFGGIFPDCFIQESGLTAFKKNSEYIICLILAAAMWQFSCRREQFEPQILKFILLSLSASILSELFFTFYVSVYGLSNLVGHCLKIIAMLFLYKALIRSVLKDPFNLIFRELKARELALQMSEEQFSRMFREHDAIMLLIGPDTGEILEANSAAARFYGYTQRQLCQMNIQQINTLPDEDVALLRSQALENKQNYFVFPHRLASGVIREVEVHSSHIVSQGKKILFSIIHDITERKKAEEELSRQKKLFETMFNTIPDGVVITNTNREIQLANKGMEDTFGYTLDTILGKTTEILYANKDHFHQTGVAVFGEKSQKQGDRYITYYKNNNGVEFPCETFGAKLFDDNNRWLGNLGIMRDITERIRQEEERETLQKQLSQAQKMEAIGTLAGGIAHDFNNILGAILGHSEFIQQAVPPDSSIGKDIDNVIISTKRGADLVKQILTFSRKTSNRKDVLHPHLFVGEAIKMLRATLPSSISIEATIDPDCGMVLANSTSIHQIVVNLCTNALHAMRGVKGMLRVDLQHQRLSSTVMDGERSMLPGDYVVLTVADNGQGMDKAATKRIFEPYFTTKKIGDGTGLGLAIVHGIIQDCRGFINVESTVGEGSTFKVFFPVVKEPVSQPAESVSTEKVTGSACNERILIVDDELLLVKINEKRLQALGYEVTGVTDSREALSIFRNQPDNFDLLITDQTMPGLTGEELAKAVLEIKPTIPVIVCTGHSDTFSKEAALSMGVRKYVLKPLHGDELLDAVLEVLDK